MLWLDILGGHVHLSLQDLVGGHFWENKPSLGFHGATSPQVGYQGPACQMIERRLGRPWWRLGKPIPPLTFQTIFPGGEKSSTFELDVMILGDRAWWWGAILLTLGRLKRIRVFTMMRVLRCFTCGLWRPIHTYPTPTTSSKWKNVP